MIKINEILTLNGQTLDDIYSQTNFFRIEMKGAPILQIDIFPNDNGYVCYIGFHLYEEMKDQYLQYKVKATRKKFLDEYMSYKERLNVY